MTHSHKPQTSNRPVSGFSGFVLLAITVFLTLWSGANATALYTAVQVSDAGYGNNIGNANTSRNVAIAPDGSINVVFSGSSGIRFAKSTDGGQSFSPSVLISTSSDEAEIEIESGGTIYVAWLNYPYTYFSKSTDGGATFSTPVFIGYNSSGYGIHIESYGSYVYVLERDGNILNVNNNYGDGSFSAVTIDWGRAFSDVKVNPDNGMVYVMTDDPYLRMYYSTDNGYTFTPVTVNPYSYIYYSSYAFSTGPLGTLMFVSGQSTQAYKIDLTTGASTYQTYGDNNYNAQGRTLAADNYGNLVDGYNNYGYLRYRVSFDQGNTWQPVVTVAYGQSHNVAIDPITNNIVVVYSMNGQVFLSVYANELKVPLSVTTNSVSNAGCSSADAGGVVVNSGAGSVSEKGVVYSLSANPTTADTKVTAGSGDGTFSVTLNDICPGTTYHVRAYAIDSWGNTYYGSDVSFTTQSPTYTLSLNPSSLWPPNHTMHSITATISSDLTCSGISYALTSVTSNESDNGLGDGDKPNDIQNATTGTADYNFDLRAERSGKGNGRIYTVTYTITDACGLNYSASATVNVPKSQGREPFALDGSSNTVTVYPNPAQSDLNVNMNFDYSADARIVIYNILGETVSTYDAYNTNIVQKQFDINNMTAGTYFVNIKFGAENYIERFVKQ